MRIRNLIYIILRLHCAESAPDTPFQGLCSSILATSTVTLADLIHLGIVEKVPGSDYAYATPQGLTPHELRTASLLAERLK